MSTDPGELLTIPQVAAMAGIKPDTLSSYVSRGQDAPAPVLRIGGRVLWRRADAEAWVRVRGAR